MFKPTILGIFIIFVFCINPITNTIINENLYNDSESTPTINSNLVKGPENSLLSGKNWTEANQKEVTDFVNNERFSVKSDTNEENLNLSVKDLVTYIKTIYENSQFRDIPRGSTSYYTTIAAMQVLSILKMTGLEEYIVPNEITTRTNIIDNLKLITSDGKSCAQVSSENKACGYPIVKDQSTPTLAGTFGAIMSIKLLGNPGFILESLSEFIIRWIINEKLFSNSTHAYFSGSSNNINEISILDNYWAIESLELLNFDFTNDSLNQKLVNTFQDLWVTTTEFSHFNDFDAGLSTLIKNYYATSALQSLNRSSSVDQSFWNEIKNDLPDWIAEFQENTGVYQGGFISSPSTFPNVLDTGSALAILSILDNSWSKIDLSSAINFILRSQYTSSSGSNANVIGGWALNNGSFGSSNPKVNTKNTFFAILGLFGSNYLKNVTKVSIETSFGRENDDSNLLNHLISGETSVSISVIVHTLDGYSYSKLNMKKLNTSIPDWNLNYTEYKKIGNNYEYEFLLQEADFNNWTWGVHKVSGFYEYVDFNLLSKSVFEFETTLVVEPRFSFSFVNTSVDEINPGTEIAGEISLDNTTLDPDESGIQDFGNFSINVYYPNGSFYPVAINNTLKIHKNTTTYWFNDTISSFAPLGEYYINISILNQTNIFTRSLSFIVNDTIIFKSINGIIESNEEIILYPGMNIDLTLDIAYSNNKIASDVKATAYFINYLTGKEIFSTDLIFQNTTIFKTNSSDEIPRELIMGDYNLSVSFVWKSSIKSLSFNSTITNTSLPFIIIKGEVLVSSEVFEPGNIVQLGDNISFTTELLIKTPDLEIQIFENFELRGIIYYQSEDNLVQTLTYEYLGNGVGLLYGEIIPNLKISPLDEKDYFLKLEYLMNSTLDFHTAKDDQNNEYIFEFSLKAALSISNVVFILGNETTNKIYTPVVIIDFVVFNQLNNRPIGLLDLNGTIKDEEGNITILSNPIVPIETEDNSSYQIQIPTTNIAVGTYNISIYTINAVEDNFYLGSITINIKEETIIASEDLPIEIFLIFGLLIIAIVVTYLRGKIIKAA